MNVTSNGTPRLRGTLGKLRRDRAGNALAMMGIGIVPLAGLVGGAVDMSRLYLTKTRLQQACDAGALAGRKVMGGGTWTSNSNAARIAAEKFFDGNFQTGDYGTSDGTRAYTEAAGKVTGTASAKVPMTLMKIFQRGTETISVNCSTEMRLPNTDVMFVLDTTGSMGSKLSGDPKTKMQGLKTAVKCFYQIVARLDINDVDCVGDEPSGGTGSTVQVRFGFVPFATNVNVGKLLPSNWFADSWTYQSRRPVTIYGKPIDYESASVSHSDWEDFGSSTTESTKAACDGRKPVDTVPTAISAPQFPEKDRSNPANPRWTDTTWWAKQQHSWKEYEAQYSGGRCQVRERTAYSTPTVLFEKTTNTAPGAVAITAWEYAPISVDITPLKNGTGWNNTITLPVGNKITNTTVTWNGCIEERQTDRRTDYKPLSTVKTSAIDLDIDREPDGSGATQWGPALGEIIYPRRGSFRDPSYPAYRNNSTGWNLNPIVTFSDFTDRPDTSCATASRKLQEWKDANQFKSYVNSLAASGNTYHDIGLLWGARLLSPTGIFKAENALTPKGGKIDRHLIFMTDGEAVTSVGNYQAYGFPWFDRRQTDPSQVPTYGNVNQGTLTQQINARTAALCEAVQNMGDTTLWVIWFGEANPYIENAMRDCATPDRFYVARNGTELQENFQRIANQISQLRLTQ